ncbi:hypothetical protein [Salinisphaera sp. S4-8]|uniref:hypothetical protein n=1 Tax=Salinisphaera sp. S4-8 TaxID=633357 RepID=UPI003342075A
MIKPMRLSKITALALTLAASLAATGTVSAAEQKIFIDPETGEIVKPPAQKSEGTNPGEVGQKARAAAPKAWKNSEGAQMLTPSFESAPMARAVRCPDGSLHMGHVGHDEASDDTEALCAAHNR